VADGRISSGRRRYAFEHLFGVGLPALSADCGDGGPVMIDLGPYRTDTARGHWLLEKQARPLEIRDGTIGLESVERFCAAEFLGVF